MNYNKLIKWTKSDSATTLCRFTKSAIEQPKAPAIQQRKKGDSQTKNSQCKANMRDSKTNMHDSETNMRHSETKNCKTNQPNNKRIIQRIPIEQNISFLGFAKGDWISPPALNTIPNRYSGLGPDCFGWGISLMPPENWLTRCGQLVSQWWAPLHFKLDLVGGLLEGFAIREPFWFVFAMWKHMKTSNSTDLTILTSVDDNCRYCKMTVRSSQVCQVMTNTSLGDEEPQWAMHRIDLFSVDLFWWKPLKHRGDRSS